MNMFKYISYISHCKLNADCEYCELWLQIQNQTTIIVFSSLLIFNLLCNNNNNNNGYF